MKFILVSIFSLVAFDAVAISASNEFIPVGSTMRPSNVRIEIKNEAMEDNERVLETAYGDRHSKVIFKIVPDSRQMLPLVEHIKLPPIYSRGIVTTCDYSYINVPSSIYVSVQKCVPLYAGAFHPGEVLARTESSSSSIWESEIGFANFFLTLKNIWRHF